MNSTPNIAKVMVGMDAHTRADIVSVIQDMIGASDQSVAENRTRLRLAQLIGQSIKGETIVSE